MPSSGMLRRVALVKTDVSEERIACITRMTRIDELGAFVVTSSRILRSVLRLLVTVNIAPGLPIFVTLIM
jgi:hypothetical protein